MLETVWELLFNPQTNAAIQELLPEYLIYFFMVITRLGDGAVLFAIAILLYWYGAERSREKRAMVLALSVTTLALVSGMKGIFQVPRPYLVAEPALAFAPEAYPGWSTPSAHAMGAAAVFGALAVIMKSGTKKQRYAIFGSLIGLIAFSRVVLGLHYVGDVIIGVILGLALVAIAFNISSRPVVSMFGLAFFIAIFAFFMGSEEFTTMSIGASLGGMIVWYLVEDEEARPLGASLMMLGIILIPLLLIFRVFEALVVVEIVVETVTFGLIPVGGFISIVGYALLFGFAVGLPYIATYLNRWDSVRYLQEAFPFRGRIFDIEDLVDQVISTEKSH